MDVILLPVFTRAQYVLPLDFPETLREDTSLSSFLPKACEMFAVTLHVIPGRSERGDGQLFARFFLTPMSFVVLIVVFSFSESPAYCRFLMFILEFCSKYGVAAVARFLIHHAEALDPIEAAPEECSEEYEQMPSLDGIVRPRYSHFKQLRGIAPKTPYILEPSIPIELDQHSSARSKPTAFAPEIPL